MGRDIEGGPDLVKHFSLHVMRKFPLLAALALCFAPYLTGCAGKNAEPAPAVPLPPQVAEKEETSDIAYAEDAGGQYLVVDISADASAGPRRGEPEELAGLLEMKGAEGKTTAVTLLRPLAVREAAQLVTFQTAIAYRYKRLLESTERYAAILDAAFDFSPLLMTEGAALIQPPVLTRSGASLRIEKPDTASSAETAYELLEPARFVPFAPHWREFLMAGAFPEPEKPNPAVLPKDDTERAIWRAAVREAWAQGLAEA
ncbi:MAG: type IV secretion system DotC family protein, partial [Desulfovibrio sp.]|nr:type IV secretion system DotC family protein [Desulfovibrio sp.]